MYQIESGKNGYKTIKFGNEVDVFEKEIIFDLSKKEKILKKYKDYNVYFNLKIEDDKKKTTYKSPIFDKFDNFVGISEEKNCFDKIDFFETILIKKEFIYNNKKYIYEGFLSQIFNNIIRKEKLEVISKNSKSIFEFIDYDGMEKYIFPNGEYVMNNNDGLIQYIINGETVDIYDFFNNEVYYDISNFKYLDFDKDDILFESFRNNRPYTRDLSFIIPKDPDNVVIYEKYIGNS